jgi:hypothetical protein
VQCVQPSDGDVAFLCEMHVESAWLVCKSDFDRRVMGACGLWVIHFGSAWRRSLSVSDTANPARVVCVGILAAGRNRGSPDRYRGGLFRIGGGRERAGRTFWRMGQGRRAFPKSRGGGKRRSVGA